MKILNIISKIISCIFFIGCLVFPIIHKFDPQEIYVSLGYMCFFLAFSSFVIMLATNLKLKIDKVTEKKYEIDDKSNEIIDRYK